MTRSWAGRMARVGRWLAGRPAEVVADDGAVRGRVAGVVLGHQRRPAAPLPAVPAPGEGGVAPLRGPVERPLREAGPGVIGTDGLPELAHDDGVVLVEVVG